VFVSFSLPTLFCAVVFVVVVVVTFASCRQSLIARVDVAVVHVLCAVEIRRLTGAIRLFVPGGWHKQIFVWTTGGVRKQFDRLSLSLFLVSVSICV
jgi:hypothetical protein